MRILAFVDLHSSLMGLSELRQKTKQKNPDIIIAAGDMTIFGDKLEWVMGKIAKLKKTTFVIPGNHEEGSPLAVVCRDHENLIYLHKKTYVKDGILFIGHGGGGFSFTSPDFENWVPKIKDKIQQHERIILITHQPPYKTKLDHIYGQHVGSKSYKNFIKKHSNKIKLVISGHIHECQKKHDKLGKTRMLNPGPSGVIIRTEFNQ